MQIRFGFSLWIRSACPCVHGYPSGGGFEFKVGAGENVGDGPPNLVHVKIKCDGNALFVRLCKDQSDGPERAVGRLPRLSAIVAWERCGIKLTVGDCLGVGAVLIVMNVA